MLTKIERRILKERVSLTLLFVEGKKLR